MFLMVHCSWREKVYKSCVLNSTSTFLLQTIKVITKVPNSEQSNKGKVKTHISI